MAITAKTKKIQEQILKDVRNHPSDLVKHISELFDISRQAVNRHIHRLVKEEKIIAEGATRNRTYKTGPIRRHEFSFSIEKSQLAEEHRIYTQQFAWLVQDLKQNVEDIVYYGFTEMVNNAIDHSDGTLCKIILKKNKDKLTIFIADNGEGIFRRIRRICDLADDRQAIIELSKGKLTTDPDNHSGQGIFFTSRMFDDFEIESKGLRFSHHDGEDFDFLDEVQDKFNAIGTLVYMSINLDTERTDKQVFDEYSGGEDEDFAFNRTIIPVRLAKVEKEQLVSRSQAKRLLTRIENFKYVAFDFEGVEKIGQAFADEIFRVYPIRHPQVILHYLNATEEVDKMISRAKHS